MGVKLDFFCCVAAELQDFKFGQETNSRLYFYRAFESQTIDDMLEPGFFNEAQDLRVGDLILLYAPNQNRGYAFAKVISTTNGIVSTQSIGLKAQDVAVDTDEFDRLSGENLQEVIEKADEQLNILWAHKADTILNFQTPITEDNLGATMAEIDALDNDLQAQITSNDADILKNTQDITALKGAGGALNASNFNTATPTQETLTKYAVDQIWPGNTNWAWNAANPAASTFTDANGVARTAAEIFNSTWVNNTYDDHRWQLTNTQNTTPKVFEWADVGRDIVSVATATTAGIVRVGSGSQMVVNPATGDISLDGTKASGIRSTIGALAANQGSSNSGLILGIDADGDVVPTESSSGGRNIGDIFLSARTNTGTAVNGAVLCNGARYNFSDINQGQNNIQALLNNGSIQSFSMAEYNAAVNSRLYVTPTFVSNSTDGHVVSDARGNSDIYTVFNGVGSKTIGNWSTYWIQERFPTNVFINSYSITADNKTNAEYPSTWELQGSNNGSSWDSLDLQKNLEFYLGEAKTFPVYLSKSYKYYRLVFIDGAESSGNGELGRVHFNVRQSSSIGYFGYDSGASYFKVPNLMDDNATVMLSPSDFETFYHDAFFAGPQSLLLQSTAIPRALSTVILKPYVQLFNGATDDAVATCTQVLQQIANIQQTLNGMDYPIYWDADDSGDHSHAKPGVATPASGTWYRLYKSGWVEQGVTTPTSGGVNDFSFAFPIPMKSTAYTIGAGGPFAIDNVGARFVVKTTTGVVADSQQQTVRCSNIVVFGWAA